MAYDLTMLTYTPDMRFVDPARAKIVGALRYNHVSKASKSYCTGIMRNYLGSPQAISSFYVFLDEAGRAWPEPIALHRPCNPDFSYDEMLLSDLCVASARNDRAPFDEMTRDMLSKRARDSIWVSARRLMRHIVSVVD